MHVVLDRGRNEAILQRSDGDCGELIYVIRCTSTSKESGNNSTAE